MAHLGLYRTGFGTTWPIIDKVYLLMILDRYKVFHHLRMAKGVGEIPPAYLGSYNTYRRQFQWLPPCFQGPSIQ